MIFGLVYLHHGILKLWSSWNHESSCSRSEHPKHMLWMSADGCMDMPKHFDFVSHTTNQEVPKCAKKGSRLNLLHPYGRWRSVKSNQVHLAKRSWFQLIHHTSLHPDRISNPLNLRQETGPLQVVLVLTLRLLEAEDPLCKQLPGSALSLVCHHLAQCNPHWTATLEENGNQGHKYIFWYHLDIKKHCPQSWIGTTCITYQRIFVERSVEEKFPPWQLQMLKNFGAISNSPTVLTLANENGRVRYSGPYYIQKHRLLSIVVYCYIDRSGFRIKQVCSVAKSQISLRKKLKRHV